MPEVDETDLLQLTFENTECGSNFFNNAIAVGTATEMSGYSSPDMIDSHGMSSLSSPMSTSMSPRMDESSVNLYNMNDTNFLTFRNATAQEMPGPQVIILDQPVDKFRFRYKSEMMGTHGSLSSASTTSRRKRQAPTAKLINYVGQNAKIRCTLVTSDVNRRIPHAHHLVKREGNVENDAPYEIEVSAENDFTAQFHGMGIIHTAKKHIKDELVRKMKMEALEKQRSKNINIKSLRVCEETQIKMDADNAQKWMNLNSVSLCFQAFVESSNGVMEPLTDPVYSIPINNLKSALTGELKICRIDKISSSCDGGEEIFMLVEKVGKKNIKVKFFETDENDQETWADYGRFSELDVHHQYAIVFRTPPYKDRDIDSPREVYIKLERPTDGDSSDPIKFTYKPTDCLLNRKRPRISYSGSSNFNKFPSSDFISNVNALNRTTLSNESLHPSRELSKLLQFNESIDFDEYARYYDDNMLITDGPSQQDETVFAEQLVNKTMKKILGDRTRNKEFIKKMFDERTTYGDKVLHSALRHGCSRTVKQILMVLASDAELKNLVDLENSSGKTALHYAVLLNQPDVVDALLSLGADPNKCDERDFSPLHAAVKQPEAGACVDILLSNKVNIETRDEAGWTPLQLAVEAGSLHAVRSLIKAGADANRTEVLYGRTALHIAVEGGHIEIVKYLLEKTNIDVNKTNLGGNTALHSAVVDSSARAEEMCKLLLKHGANPHIANHNREPSDTGENDLFISVKDEPKDDDDSEEMEEDAGQTSFDLASNKPQILQLFTQTTDDTKNLELSNVLIKEEVSEDDTLMGNLDSGLLKELSSILDKNRSWVPLAKHLNCEYLLSALDTSKPGPSLTILNYADVQGNLSIKTLIDLLKKIKDTEASAFVDKVLKRRSEK